MTVPTREHNSPSRETTETFRATPTEWSDSARACKRRGREVLPTRETPPREYPLKIIYLQYTDPTLYPPLEHSSRILADRGWGILFLGASPKGSEGFKFPPHPSIKVRCLPQLGNGRLIQLQYLIFFLWSLLVCVIHRPKWLYVSDPLASPTALVIRFLTGARLVYHEHDLPTCGGGLSKPGQFFRTARRWLACKSELCILPQQERIRSFVAETRRKKVTMCVWNCPRREEICAPRCGDSKTERKLTLYYHGSINDIRLPLTVIEALAQTKASTKLVIVGYETIGSKGYVRALIRRADEMRVSSRVEFLGSRPRSELFSVASNADVGLMLMPKTSIDINARYMVGASNKAFDYLAAGQMLLISDLPDWREQFEKPGFARVCRPEEVESLIEAITWCEEN